MHVARLTSIITVAVVASLAIACGSSNSNTPTTPTPTVTFSTQIQQQIFTPACAPCHTDDGRTPPAGLNLRAAATSYANLVGVASTGKAGATRVIAGNPSGSYLVQKLEGAADIVGLRMPRNGPPFLTDAQVALIRQWIQIGAPNN
jgi:mono/diheme cytochrome c family protein